MKDRGIFSEVKCAAEESDKELIARNHYRRHGLFTSSARDLNLIARNLQGELQRAHSAEKLQVYIRDIS